MHSQEDGTTICGPVAIWNANKYLTSKKMPSLRSLVRDCNITQKHGCFYWDITSTLTKHNMYDRDDSFLHDKETAIQDLKSGFPVIVLYSWAEKGVFNGAHYVLVTMKNGVISVWNNGKPSKVSHYDDYNSFDKDLLTDCPWSGKWCYPYFWKVCNPA
jgi:hypothetical protein